MLYWWQMLMTSLHLTHDSLRFVSSIPRKENTNNDNMQDKAENRCFALLMLKYFLTLVFVTN